MTTPTRIGAPHIGTSIHILLGEIGFEVFHNPTHHTLKLEDGVQLAPGWYWREFVDIAPTPENSLGPFLTSEAAVRDCQYGWDSMIVAGIDKPQGLVIRMREELEQARKCIASAYRLALIMDVTGQSSTLVDSLVEVLGARLTLAQRTALIREVDRDYADSPDHFNRDTHASAAMDVPEHVESRWGKAIGIITIVIILAALAAIIGSLLRGRPGP